MMAVFDRIRPDLFLSVNDHELTFLAGPVADKLRGYGGIVLSLDTDRQQVVADKHAMALSFAQHGISCPPTVLASDSHGVAALAGSAGRLVIKDRYGSGSSGFAVVRAADVSSAIALRCRPDGGIDPDLLVVQPFLSGVEFGLDIVSDLTDSAEVTGVLARRKDATVSAVTTRVVTVDPAGFLPLAERIARVVRPQGPIDVDLIETEESGLQVLDVNPRFGGGYPFSHCAGSDVPGYLIAELLGLPPPDGWNTCRIGATIGRHDSFVSIG
jgi:carbamoyl-phosphate synthase large subunit